MTEALEHYSRRSAFSFGTRTLRFVIFSSFKPPHPDSNEVARDVVNSWAKRCPRSRHSEDANVQQAAQIASNITEVNRGAGETGSGSAQVLYSAKSPSCESNHLKIEVEKFLDMGLPKERNNTGRLWLRQVPHALRSCSSVAEPRQ